MKRLFFSVLLLGGCAAGAPHTAHTPAKPAAPSGPQPTLAIGAPETKPGAPATFTFQVFQNGAALKEFKITHEKLLHLIIVREDLEHYQHLHPALDEESGTFTQEIAFPEPGPYVFFADLHPEGRDPAVLRASYTVPGDYTARGQAADDAPKRAGAYTVEPTVASPLPAGIDLMLVYEITKGGRPISDLQNYLGAKGHAVILKEKSLDYVHVHPTDEGAGHGGTITAEPGQVLFATKFPSPGRYKVFTQFRPEGELVTVAHVFDVTAAPEGARDDHAGGHPEDAAVRTFDVAAFQWGFEPDELRVKKGEHVTIRLTTRDVAHGFAIGDLGISETILPGKTATVEFVADKAGRFTFGCDVACGEDHDDMARAGGTLIVE